MKRALFVFVAILFGVSSDAQKISRFVAQQVATYPRLRLLDIYKSCFQDYMGAEHLVADTSSAKDYLQKELALVERDALMPWLYEYCGVKGRHVRVSLRAVKEGLVPEALLLDAFVRSAAGAGAKKVSKWRKEWQKIIARIEKMNLRLPQFDADRQFIDSLLLEGKYAISHSPDYREAYSPHYRIVERRIFEREIKPLLEAECRQKVENSSRKTPLRVPAK